MHCHAKVLITCQPSSGRCWTGQPSKGCAIPAFWILAFVLIAATVKILREYERAVVFTLGRFEKVKGPGLVLLLPFIQEMVRVDLRIQVIEIPTQDVISH